MQNRQKNNHGARTLKVVVSKPSSFFGDISEIVVVRVCGLASSLTRNHADSSPEQMMRPGRSKTSQADAREELGRLFVKQHVAMLVEHTTYQGPVNAQRCMYTNKSICLGLDK